MNTIEWSKVLCDHGFKLKVGPGGWALMTWAATPLNTLENTQPFPFRTLNHVKLHSAHYSNQSHCNKQPEDVWIAAGNFAKAKPLTFSFGSVNI